MAEMYGRGAAEAAVPDTMDGLRAQNRAYRSLCASLEAQMAILTEKGREYQEAVTTLNSEREANALLTDEIEALRVENGRMREALLPFDNALGLCEDMNERTQSAPHSPREFVRFVDFQKARAALIQTKDTRHAQEA